MNNSTFGFTLDPEIVWIVEGVLAIIGLGMNFMILFTLYIFRRKFYTNNFWLLAKHLCIPNVIFLLIILLYVVPCTINDDHVFGYNVDQILANVFATTYYTNLMLMMCISLDRFVKVVIQKHWAIAVNSYKCLRVMVILSWAYSIFIVLLLNLFGCRREYSVELSRFPNDCPTNAISSAMLGLNYLTVAFIIALYTSILVYVRIQVSEINSNIHRILRSRRISERRLAVNFLFCVVFTILALVISPLVPWPMPLQVQGFLTIICLILNSVVSPCALLFSSQLRKCIVITCTRNSVTPGD